MKTVLILVLNWKEASLTIDCLKSLNELVKIKFDILVLDNNSNDQSVKKINSFILASGFQNISIIENSSNLGYAAGNNIGIKYGIKNGYEYIWLLNNDIEVDKNSLSNAIKKLDNGFDVVGSKILYFDSNKVWAAGGGKLNKFFMTSKNILNGFNKDQELTDDENFVESHLDYLAGAAMLFRTSAFKKVGLLSEDYFLYFEEPDWFTRAKSKNIRVGYCCSSIIYHHVGASTDNYNNSTKKLFAFKKLIIKNKIKFTLKFYQTRAPLVVLSIVYTEILNIIFILAKKLRK